MSWRAVLGICAAWALAGVVLGGQGALDAAMRGGTPAPLSAAFIQTLPWIPLTLGAAWLAAWRPFTRAAWARPLAAHLPVAIALAFVANVLVVLAYMGARATPRALVAQGALWTMLRLHVALLVYAATVVVTQGALYWRSARERELRVARLEGQLARAHVQTLNAQIRPHFLFNTLHTIGQLWRSGRSDDADAVLDHLGALFHKVQRSTARFEVPLAEELDLVREYLAIEQARLPDRLRTTVDASEEALRCQVPPLILQPLVENAIRHGIAAVSTAGRVEVRADVDDGRLVMLVRDDGPGANGASRRPGSGTGLRNTRERLAQLYGAAASLRVDPADGGGTLVRIDMPRRHEVADPDDD